MVEPVHAPAASPAAAPPPPPPPARGPRLQRLAGALLALLLLGLLLRSVDGPALLATAAQVPAAVWLLTLAGGLASLGLRAARMQAEWRQHPEARFGTCLRIFLFHNAAVAWLPLRSGEGVYLWWLTRRWRVPLADALASLLWLRLQDAAVLAWVTLAAFGPGSGAASLLPAVLLALLGLGLGPRLWAALLRRADTPALHEGTALRARLGRRLLAACQASRGGRYGWLLCAGNWVIKISVIAVLLQALAPLTFADAARGALLGEWAAILPLNGPAGLGPYEAGVWLGAQAQSLAPSPPTMADLVGAALLAHLAWLLISGLSAALAWALRPSPSPLPETVP